MPYPADSGQSKAGFYGAVFTMNQPITVGNNVDLTTIKLDGRFGFDNTGDSVFVQPAGDPAPTSFTHLLPDGYGSFITHTTAAVPGFKRGANTIGLVLDGGEAKNDCAGGGCAMAAIADFYVTATCTGAAPIDPTKPVTPVPTLDIAGLGLLGLLSAAPPHPLTPTPPLPVHSSTSRHHRPLAPAAAHAHAPPPPPPSPEPTARQPLPYAPRSTATSWWRSTKPPARPTIWALSRACQLRWIALTAVRSAPTASTSAVSTTPFSYLPPHADHVDASPPSDMAWVNGLMYSTADNGQLYSIDVATGTTTAIGTPDATGGVLGAQFSGTNGLFGAANNGSGLYRVNLTTGRRDKISDSPASGSNDGASCPTVALFEPLPDDPNLPVNPAQVVAAVPALDVAGLGLLSLLGAGAGALRAAAARGESGAVPRQGPPLCSSEFAG